MSGSPAPVRGRLLDLEYQIEVFDDALADYIGALYRDSLDDDISDPEVFGVHLSSSGGFVVTVDGLVVDAPARGPWALSSLVWHVNRRVVARSLRPVLLHAGAVAFGGRAVIVVGRSGAGKTTTVAALVRSGGAYLTDDVVAVGFDGHLAGAVKPIGLRHPSPDLLGLGPDDLVLPPEPFRTETGTPQVHLAASSLVSDGKARLVRSAGPAVLVFLDQALASGEVVQLPRSECLARLTEFAFDLDQRGAAGFEALAALARGSSGFAWGRGPLDSILGVFEHALNAATLRET